MHNLIFITNNIKYVMYIIKIYICIYRHIYVYIYFLFKQGRGRGIVPHSPSCFVMGGAFYRHPIPSPINPCGPHKIVLNTILLPVPCSPCISWLLNIRHLVHRFISFFCCKPSNKQTILNNQIVSASEIHLK